MSKKELTVTEEIKETAVIEMTEEQADKLVQTITNKYNKIDKGFLGIMGDIAKAYDNGIHTYYGYTSFYDMASDRWGIGKTSVKNMVAINRRFGTNYRIGKDWQEFGTSKLLLIKDLSDEDIEALEITADLSREEVADKVREFKGIGKKDDNDVVETTEDDNDVVEPTEEEMQERDEALKISDATVRVKVSHETLSEIFAIAREAIDSEGYEVTDEINEAINTVIKSVDSETFNVLFDLEG